MCRDGQFYRLATETEQFNNICPVSSHSSIQTNCIDFSSHFHLPSFLVIKLNVSKKKYLFGASIKYPSFCSFNLFRECKLYSANSRMFNLCWSTWGDSYSLSEQTCLKPEVTDSCGDTPEKCLLWIINKQYGVTATALKTATSDLSTAAAWWKTQINLEQN